MATSSLEDITEVNIELDNKKLISFYITRGTTLQKVRQLINEHQPLKDTQFFLNKSGFPIGRADENRVPIHKLFVSEDDGLIKMQTQAEQEKKHLLDILTLPEISTTHSFQTFTPVNFAEFRPVTIPQTSASNPLSNDQICNPEKFDSIKWENILMRNNLFKGLIFSNDKYKPVSNSRSPLVRFKSNINVAKIIVDTMNTNDSTFIEAYLSNNERCSTLIKDKLIKLDVNFQCPFISFAIGGESEENKMADRQTKTLYTTCTWNFPRVEVHLFDTTMPANQQYLVPTDQFRKEIEEVFESTSSIENQYSQLEEIFKCYGQVYPKNVILGGHLYQTDVQIVDKSEDEEKHRAVVRGQFKGFIDKIWSGVGGGGGGQETQDKHRKVETDRFSLSQCEATGGQTLLIGNGSIGDWISSVGNSDWWRVIQYGELIPTYRLLDKELQKKIEEVEQYHKKSFSSTASLATSSSTTTSKDISTPFNLNHILKNDPRLTLDAKIDMFVIAANDKHLLYFTNGTIRLIDEQGKEKLKCVRPNSSIIDAYWSSYLKQFLILDSKNSKLLALDENVSGRNKVLEILDLNKPRSFFNFFSPPRLVRNMTCYQESLLVAISDGNPIIEEYNLSNRQLVQTYNVPFSCAKDQYLGHIRYNSSGSYIGVIVHDGTLSNCRQFFQLRKSNMMCILKQIELTHSFYIHLLPLPDDMFLAGSYDKKFYIINSKGTSYDTIDYDAIISRTALINGKHLVIQTWDSYEHRFYDL